MYDAAQTGVNPAETVLGTGNVSRLRRAWSRDLLVGGGSPVVAGGRVYLGVTGGNGNPGTRSDWWHPPAVSRGAVYATGTVNLVVRFSLP